MRIQNLCLASFYIDNNSYQENILSQMHKNQGHDGCVHGNLSG